LSFLLLILPTSILFQTKKKLFTENFFIPPFAFQTFGSRQKQLKLNFVICFKIEIAALLFEQPYFLF